MASTSTKPGLTPLPNIEDPPRSHAWTMRSRSAPSPLPLMNAAVLTTLTPASRIRTSSSTSDHIGVYSTQSGCRASSAATSSVAATPTGSDRRARRRRDPPCRRTRRSTRPGRGPGVRPRARADRLPTLPVVHCTMRDCHLSFPVVVPRSAATGQEGEPILRKSQLTILSGRMRTHACRPSWCTCPPAYLSA